MTLKELIIELTKLDNSLDNLEVFKEVSFAYYDKVELVSIDTIKENKVIILS